VETPFASSSGINMLFKVVFGVKGWNASGIERIEEKKLVGEGGIWHVAKGLSYSTVRLCSLLRWRGWPSVVKTKFESSEWSGLSYVSQVVKSEYLHRRGDRDIWTSHSMRNFPFYPHVLSYRHLVSQQNRTNISDSYQSGAHQLWCN
jgi:hypothetical protein